MGVQNVDLENANAPETSCRVLQKKEKIKKCSGNRTFEPPKFEPQLELPFPRDSTRLAGERGPEARHR
jgi:hypothetical protein